MCATYLAGLRQTLTIWGRVSQNSNLFLEGAQRKKEMQKCREYLYKLDIFLKKADRVLSNYYEQILIVSYFVKADLLRDHTPEESAHGLQLEGALRRDLFDDLSARLNTIHVLQILRTMCLQCERRQAKGSAKGGKRVHRLVEVDIKLRCLLLQKVLCVPDSTDTRVHRIHQCAG